MENEYLDFEDLPLNEQLKKLEAFLYSTSIHEKIPLDQIDNVVFSKLNNGNSFYTLKTRKDGFEKNTYFKKDEEGHFSEIDLKELSPQLSLIKVKISELKTRGFDVSQMEEQRNKLVKDYDLKNLRKKREKLEEFAKSLEVDPEELDKYPEIAGDKEFQKNIKKKSKETNLTIEEIREYGKVDKNGKITIDPSKIEKDGPNSKEISGDEKITTNASLNSILGKKFETYKVVKSIKGESFVLGINKDGSAEKIDNSVLQYNDTPRMSLMRRDGSIKDVSVAVSFTVSNIGSEFHDKEVIGMYNDNGNMSAFYGRADSENKILGEDIEKDTQRDEDSRVNQSRMLDTTYNKDINSEVKSANDRTSDGCIGKVEKINSESIQWEHADRQEIIDDFAKKYDLDSKYLNDKVTYNQRERHEEFSDKTDYESIKKTAEEEKEKQEKLEKSRNDEDQKSPEPDLENHNRPIF